MKSPIEHIVDLEEEVHSSFSGMNIGGFPCGAFLGVVFVLF